MTLRAILEQYTFTGNQNIETNFGAIATALLYDGFIKVRDNYRVYIKTVEFYLHAEKESTLAVSDPIVYHRDGKFPNRKIPYFPLMALHAHISGFDITFENEELKYRASALIRAYAIYDVKAKCFIETKKGCKYDDRSTYLYDFLNGFSSEGNNNILWIDKVSNVPHELNSPQPRRNVFEYEGEKKTDKRDMRPWSYTRKNNIVVDD